MKPREVDLMLRVKTDVPLAVLRKASNYSGLVVNVKVGVWDTLAVLQAQANVVEPWDVQEGKHATLR